MFIVIEPGVTFQQVKDYLEQNHRSTAQLPAEPPWTSVVANALLNGLANLSFRGSTMDQW